MRVPVAGAGAETKGGGPRGPPDADSCRGAVQEPQGRFNDFIFRERDVKSSADAGTEEVEVEVEGAARAAAHGQAQTKDERCWCECVVRYVGKVCGMSSGWDTELMLGIALLLYLCLILQ